MAYTDGAKTLADGIGALKGQSTTLISGVADLAASVRTLTDGVITLDEALNTPMGKKEKEAACEKAQSAAQAVVDAQFADNANPQGYNQIKAQAETQFTGGRHGRPANGSRVFAGAGGGIAGYISGGRKR